MLLVLATYKLGDALATAMLRPMLVDHGMSLTDIGWAMGVAAFTAGLLGALVGGALVGPLGRRRALVLFGLLQALGVAGYALLASQPSLGLAPVCALLGFEHFAGGMATVALFTIMMDTARPEHAAADYTVQASVVVVTTGVGALLAGVLADRAGYVTHFGVAALLSLLGVAVAAYAVARRYRPNHASTVQRARDSHARPGRLRPLADS
jgi:MFS family permease